MWLDWLVFCDYGLCACPLLLLTTPTILVGIILPWTWGISSRLLQQSAATASYLGREVSPHSCPSWPSMWSSSFQPPCACTATALWTAPCSTIVWPQLHSRSMKQGKLEVVKQEMARVNVDILGISKLKWTGMGEFNSVPPGKRKQNTRLLQSHSCFTWHVFNHWD